MKYPSRPHDISIRFPKDKKYLKKKLVRIAEKNAMPVTSLLTTIIEDWLESGKILTIKK